MGVIDCLSAGFRFLGWRLELILIPVVLDIILWLGPRFSVEALFQQAATSYGRLANADGVTPDMAQTVQQLAGSLADMGKEINLLSGLVSGAILHVPSLLVSGIPAPSTWTIAVGSVGEALALWLLFSMVGLLIGVIYLGLLARRLPIGGLAQASGAGFAAVVIRQWLQVMAFVIVTGLLLLVVYVPISLIVGVLMLISPSLGSAAAFGAGALTLIVFLFLYFVSPALVMDNVLLPAAVRRSVLLVQQNLWPTLGFVVLTNFIGLGFALLLTQLAGLGPWATVVAIVVNAYLGTGLAMALLVFYRTRLIRGQEIGLM